MNNVLYEESRAAGRDEENNRYPNGLWVRLSKWESEHPTWNRLPSHCIIEEIVMIDRQIVHDTRTVLFLDRFEQDSVYIRKAVDAMNLLVRAYPQCDDTKGE